MLRALDETGAMVAGQVMTGGRAAPTRRPRVVIVGAGFGGINAAMGLKSADVDVRHRPPQLPPVPASALPGCHRRTVARPDRHADPPHTEAPEERHCADGQGRRHR